MKKRTREGIDENQSNKAHKPLSSEEKLREALLVFKEKPGDNPVDLINKFIGLHALEDALKSFKTEDNLQKSALDILEEIIPNTDIVNLVEILGEQSHYPFVSWFIAQTYKYGIGIEKNDSLYVKYCSRAAENGNPQAMFAMSNIHKSGYKGVVKKDSQISLMWLQAALNGGDPKAFCTVGDIYFHGRRGFNQDQKKAFEYYQKAAELGDATAAYKVGNFWYNGKEGIEQDFKKAFKYYERAVSLGHGDALSCLASCYEFGRGIEKDEHKAMALYQESSWEGNQHATINYQRLYHKLYENYEDKMHSVQSEFENLNPLEQCLGYLNKINKDRRLSAPKLALSDFIHKMKKDDLVEMLVNLPHIGLGESEIDIHLFNALSTYPDFFVSQLVDTPLETLIKDEKKNITDTEPKPVKTTDGEEHLKIPRILKEALEIQSERRKSFAEGVQVLPQWQPEGSKQTIPSYVLANIVSYLPRGGLPVKGTVEIVEEIDNKKNIQQRDIVQTVIRKHQTLHNTLQIQLGEIDNLKAFGKHAYKTKNPEVKPVFLDMITVASEKTVRNVEENLTTFPKDRENWVNKYNTEKSNKKTCENSK